MRKLVCLLALAAASLFAAGDKLPVAPGWDWSLPTGIQPVPYSGFVTWGGKRFSEKITVFGLTVNWRTVCPEPGVHDWKPVLEAVEKAKAQGLRIGLHVKGVERQAVPEWVIRKYDVPVIKVAPLQENQPWRLEIVPPWHPDVQREYAAFLEALGQTGIPQRPEVVYGYIHGVSPSRGEELFLRPIDIDEWEKTAGLTPELLGRCLKLRLDGLLKAFKGVEYKLAWMSGGPVAAGQKGHEAYARETAGLMEYALEHGAGFRGGAVDFQHSAFRSKPLGTSVTADGYCLIDESLPIHSQGRYNGDENEEYGKYWEWRFGPAEQHAYRHRIATLRTLQLRQNFQLIAPATLEYNPELNEYARLTQGRSAANSPDAWAYLRECAIRSERGPLLVKNIERWLVQRDVEGSRSVACERIDRHPLPNFDPPDRSWDFDARRTGLGNGQAGLAFQLDRKFWSETRPAILKVTFTDHEPATWYVEYSGEAKRKSAAVENSGDGQRKTATFELGPLAAARAFPGEMDFRIVTAGPGDITVTMVRILKANWRE
jgi:hypothetical protein